jgi:hypothetical protein
VTSAFVYSWCVVHGPIVSRIAGVDFCCRRSFSNEAATSALARGAVAQAHGVFRRVVKALTHAPTLHLRADECLNLNPPSSLAGNRILQDDLGQKTTRRGALSCYFAGVLCLRIIALLVDFNVS